MRAHCPHTILLLTLLLLSACRPAASVPDTFADTDEPVVVWPDVDGTTVPPNIAPLTFVVSDEAADAFVVQMVPEGEMAGGAVADAESIVLATSSGLVQPDAAAWRALLRSASGRALSITVYARREGQWLRHRPLTVGVAREPIDPYLSYRLIEPGYELYRQLGLYQRDLTTYEEQPIYENNRRYSDGENHCVNCHNYQANDTRRMLFHVRANHGGTMLIEDGRIRKIAIRHDSILGAGVYPSWHPTLPLVAFSTNLTGQIFHMQHRERIEVLDEGSDLLLYDAHANTVCHIPTAAAAPKQFETFPCWVPTGDRLYYASASVPDLPDSVAPSDLGPWMMDNYARIRYDLWSIPFDTVSRAFGEPRLEVECASAGKSASLPRVSPDGRFLLYTLADYGQFHIWHKSADLWIKPLGGGEPYPLTAANSPDADSYHAWSANSRWIAFSSRRDDGNFTRIYISFVDADGQVHKPFLLPQRDPRQNLLLLKSYNVPELTRNPVRVPASAIRQAVLSQEPDVAAYRE